MSQALIDLSEQPITIKLYYRIQTARGGHKKIVVIEEKEAEKQLADETTKKDIEVLTTTWKSISWRDDNVMVKESTFFNSGSGMSDLDPFHYRDLKIKRCLTGWDMKDDSGQDIIFKPALIDKMPADIVYSLLSKYEMAVGIDQEDEKK